MEGLKRGDVVLVALQGDYGKPRPALVVQADLFNATHPSVTILPLTSELRNAALFRIDVVPSAENGGSKASQIMLDNYRRSPAGKSGPASGASMTRRSCS